MGLKVRKDDLFYCELAGGWAFASSLIGCGLNVVYVTLPWGVNEWIVVSQTVNKLIVAL